MFVLLLLGLLYAWMKKVRNTTPSVEKLGREEILDEAASDAADPGSGNAPWNVPLDKLLGFCYLLCGDRRNGTVYEYHLPER